MSGKHFKLNAALTGIILLGYILNVFFAYRLLQSSNIITVWNKVISLVFILTILLNFAMTVYSAIESKKCLNKENVVIFIINKFMFVSVLGLFIVGYFFWKSQT